MVLVQRVIRSLLAAAFAGLLAACGGGGGGDPAPAAGTTPTPVPAANAKRTGSMVYAFIDKVYVVDMASGNSRVLLTQDYKESYAGAAVAPGGEVAVAFNGSVPGSGSRVTILKPDGAIEVSTKYTYSVEGQPKFSKDGSKLAFPVKAGLGTNSTDFVQVVARDGKELYFFRNYTNPDWTPDDRLVMYNRADANLYLSSPGVGPVSLIANSKNAVRHSVSPDGTRIATVRQAATAGNPRRVYMMNLDGSGSRQVTTSTYSEQTRVIFSPDGKELLVTSAGCVVVSSTGLGAGSVDDDLIHVIAADGPLIDMPGDKNSDATRLVNESGNGRCTAGPPSWR
jgi:Tol biopolymer transport system component